MEDSGFKDPLTFVKALEVQAKASELQNGGMNEDSALQAATEYVDLKHGADTPSKADIDVASFLEWHGGKVSSGKFEENITSMEDIPQSVIDAHKSGKSTLKEAYMEHLLESVKVDTEQKTLKNIAKNKTTSPSKVKTPAPAPSKMTAEQIENILIPMNASDRGKWVAENMSMVEKSGYFGGL